MAKELDITINLVDGGAKQTAQEIDQALDATAASADKAGVSIGLLEGKLALAKAQLANTNTEMRMLTAAMADMSGGAQAKLQGELTVTGERMVQARQKVGDLSTELKNAKGATDEATSSMSTMDRMAERLVMRMALLQGLRMAFQFTEGLFTASAAISDLSKNLGVSTDKVQEWQYASRQTGISMGALTGAADTLGKKIAGGSESVTSALQQLGLDTDQYFSADPAERFDQTAAAIAQMGDKTERTGVEMALFGTDKIDPLILKLNGLEKAAHDAGQVIGPVSVQQLADADKAFQETTNAVKVVAAEWLVAAQNAVYYLEVTQEITANGGVRDKDANPYGTLPPLPGSPKNTSGGMGAPGALNPLDPSKKAGLQAIAALEKELTTEIEIQMAAEKAQLALEKMMFQEREHLYKKIQEEMKKTSEMYVKVTNDAVIAELAAKARNNAALGLDIHGNPEGLGKTPGAIAAKAQHELDVSAATSPGISTAARQQEINDTFLKSVLKDAQAADEESAARGAATSAATQLSAAHAGAVVAVDAMSGAFASFRGVLVGTVDAMSGSSRNAPLSVSGSTGMYTGDNLGMASGSGVGMAGSSLFTAAGRSAGLTNGVPHFANGGFASSPMQAVVGDSPGGEYMIPAKKMDQMLAGGGKGDIHVTINGNVDSELRARQLADQVAARVFRTLRNQTRT